MIDTKNDSLIAEKTMYLFDYGLGSGSERGMNTGAGRQPWSFAENCPNNKVYDNQLRFFLEKVLKPKQPNIDSTNEE